MFPVLLACVLTASAVPPMPRQESAALPQPLAFRVPPQLRFLAPGSAEITWETREPGPGHVLYGLSSTSSVQIASTASGARHRIHLTDLTPSTPYVYRIVGATVDGAQRVSDEYTFDTSLNYMPAAPGEPDALPGDDGISDTAAAILEHTGVRRGLCVVHGLVDGRLLQALTEQSQLNILGIETDAQRVRDIRAALYRRNLYGSRITVVGADSSRLAAIPASIANLVTSESAIYGAPLDVSPSQFLKLLSPGGTACIPGGEDSTYTPFLKTLNRFALVDRRIPVPGIGTLHLCTAPPRTGAGSWTHQYANLGATSYSGEALAGVTKTDDMDVQWLGRPGPDFGIDRNPRMPAPLAVSGRLFHQGMNRIIGMDAWNGSVLWQTEAPDLRRVNMPRDASNWCADEQNLYVAIRNQAWALDQVSGSRQRTIPIPVRADSHDWGYLAHNGAALIGSAVKRDSPYTAFWTGGMWYDKVNDASAAKVCSDALFAVAGENNTPAWTYERGVIINTTICGDGRNLFFIESRHPDLRAMKTGRIADAKLWQDQYLVALDARTGAVRWERPIDTEDGIVVFFMQSNAEHLIITASVAGKYHLYDFDPANGAQRWSASHSWTADNHSGHMQHPVLYDDTVYLEPHGYRLSDGKRLEKRMGGREGCHIYVGAEKALLYRGKARQVCLWNRETGNVSWWSDLRPSCWLSAVPANGMILVPESGGGCSCGRWLETSIAFVPRQQDGSKQESALINTVTAGRTHVSAPIPDQRLSSAYRPSSSWPTFRHDNRRSCATEDSLSLPLEQAWAWRSPEPPDPAWTGPAKWDAYSSNRGLQSLRNFDPVFYVTAADGRVFFGSSADDAVHCLDIQSGREKWVRFTGAPVRLPPTWHNGVLLAGSDDGNVYALDAADGREYWRYSPAPDSRRILNNGNLISPAPCRSGVLVSGEVAYFSASLLPWQPSWLCGLNIRTGRPEGAGTFVREQTGLTLQGAMLATADTMYAPQGRSPAQTYSLADGAPLGAIDGTGGIDCLVTMDGRFISGPKNQKAGDNVVRVSDAGTRKGLQTVSGAARLVANASHAFYHDGRQLVCIDRTTQDPLVSERATVAARKPVDKAAVAALDKKIKACVVWQCNAPTPLGYALTPERLVVGSEKQVDVYDIRDGRRLWQAQVPGKAYGLAIAEGRLLVSTDRGDIICFEPRK